MLSDIEHIYKYLHKHPELSFEEFNTTKVIEEYLQNINNLYKENNLKIYKLGKTGLIAVIDKGHKSTICFRADIDALPIQEKNRCEYTSQNKNVMHACGHDGHMSILLDFISKIYEEKLKYNKNLIFIFQPAEEVDGGARLVLENKFFQGYKIDYVFGMHMWPELPSGTIGLKSENLMGTNLVFNITINGKSAHVCTPQNGIDSMTVLSELIQNINYLIAKYKNPFDPVVINIGKIKGGNAPNIIIDKLTLDGTVRAASNEILESVKKEILNIIKSLEIKYRCTIVFKQMEITYPIVYNDKFIIDEVQKILQNKNKQYEILKNPTLACEDFGFYCSKYSAAFFFLGTYSKEYPNMLHTPNFSFDINILNKGVDLYKILLENFGN